MARQDPEERAAQAVALSARQLRRFYEKGGSKIDSTLVPFIYQVAPTIDFLSRGEPEHPKAWKNENRFKNAIKVFRSQAERAGYTLPAASQDWISFDPARPIPTNEASDESQSAPRQNTPISISSTSSTPEPAKDEDVSMSGVDENISTAPTSRDPSSAPPDTSAPSIRDPPSAPHDKPTGSTRDPSSAPPDTSSPSIRDPPSAPHDTSTRSTRDPSSAPPDTSASSIRDPPSAPPDTSASSIRDPPSAPPDTSTRSTRDPSSAPTDTSAPSARDPTAPLQPSIETPPPEQSNDLPKDIWPRFSALVPVPNSSPGWRALQQECLLYGCDFADVKFRCEFRLKHEVKDNAEGLRAFAADWIRICPEALDFLDGDCHGDSIMKSHIVAYRSQHPRKVPQRSERDSSSRARLFSEDPEHDRQHRGFVNHLKEIYDGWDAIKLEEDPDKPENGEVMGKITFAVAGWLDVALPSLNMEHSEKERHILVRESDYPEAAKRFAGTTEGNSRSFNKSADKNLLRNKKRADFKVVSYSSAKQERGNLWPRTYTAAFLNGEKNSLNVWARTSWHYFGKSSIDKEINDSREEVGQLRISIAK